MHDWETLQKFKPKSKNLKFYKVVLIIAMKDFPYTVIYTRNRNAYAKVQGDGSLLFSIPQRCKHNQTMFNSLLQQGEKLYQRHAQRPQLQKWDTEGVYLFGERVAWEELQPCSSAGFPVASTGLANSASLFFSGSPKAKEKFFKTQLQEYANEWLEMFTQQLGVSCTSLSIRKASSRWGSCSHDGKIMLNLVLVHLPTKYTQYIIAHEVAHLVHKHHQKSFWELVGKLYPGYQAVRKELRKLRIG
jgi:hypothetical protein